MLENIFFDDYNNTKVLKYYFRSSTMQAIRFLNELKRMQYLVFTIEDTVKLLNKPRAYAILYLNRLEKKGLIARIERGRYALKEGNALAIASNIVFPSYISLWMAFQFYHLTTQLPNAIQIISSRQKRHIELEYFRVRFIKIEPSRIFGFRKIRDESGYIYIAEKERAVIDALYFLGNGPDLDDIRHALKECDITKLEHYAIRMKSTSLMLRLGYLLELEKLHVPESFNGLKYGRYVLLNPLYQRKGEKNKKWRIIANYRFDEYDQQG